MDLLPRVRSRHVDTARLRMHVLESGPAAGVPVVLVHGNLSSGRTFEHLMPGAPDHLRLIAPDMRSFGDSDHRPIDATRGLADWADDLHALLEALGVDGPVHLAGWSTGAAAVAAYLLAGRPVASLTLIAPVSPYGWGGVREDGTPCFPDHAGSGGGTADVAFVARIAARDRSRISELSPRTVVRALFGPGLAPAPEREEVLLEELLKSRTGADGYPGDSVPSEHWPGVAPGTRGILNALSPKHCDWSGIVDVEPKPPILWVHGSADATCSDCSDSEAGGLGARGDLPGWPGPDVFPPQPMVAQLRAVLARYRDAGGRVQAEWFEGSGHGVHLDAADRFAETFFGFLATAR